MTKESKVLRQIRSLLKRARHEGAETCELLSNEAETALAMAQKLMDEYGLSETEIVLDDESPDEVTVDPDSLGDEKVHEQKSQIDRWVAGCSALAARVAGCRIYTTHQKGRKGRSTTRTSGTIHFYGEPQDVAVATAIFPWLVKQMNRATSAFIKEHFNVSGVNPKLRASKEARSFRDGWLGGCGRAISEQIRERAERGETQVTSGGTALMVPTSALILAKKNALDVFGKRIELRVGKVGSRDNHGGAFYAGRAAGSRTRLDRNQLS